MTIALLLAGVVLLGVAQHPFVTFPLSLLLLSRLRPRPVAGGALPQTAALCVCAYREERVIRDKALNMLAMREAFPALDLLIYVDGGAEGDSTAALLAAFEPAIQVVRAPARTGKTAGMNTLLTLTAADCVIFSDANVTFDASAVQALLRPFADPEVGVACGHLRYREVRGSATAAAGSLYWRFEEALKRLESATGSVMGADGSIFAMRRRYCRPVPPHLIDDMYTSLAALCDGARIVRVEDALAYEDQVSRSAEEFRRKIRIACQAFNVYRSLRPRLARLAPLDRYKFVSHKLIRWFVAPIGAAGFAALAAGLASAGAWALLGLLALATLAAILLPQTRALLLAFLGASLGVLQSIRGQHFQTWEPPSSSRSLGSHATVAQ